MADIKISELPETTDLEGLYTIGTDKNNLSKKVSFNFLKDAANYANMQGDYAKEVGDSYGGKLTELGSELGNKTSKLYGGNIIVGSGIVTRDGQIKNNVANWYRSALIDIDDIPSNTIMLSELSSGDDRNKAAGYVCFDSQLSMVKYSEYGVQQLEKRTLPASTKYIMFSFYEDTNVTIRGYDYNASILSLNSKQGRLNNNIIFGEGVVSRSGEVQSCGVSQNWYRSDFIVIEDILSDTIELSESSNGNNSNPNAAGYAIFDKERQFISASDNGVRIVNKSTFPDNAYYVMFSFYGKTNVTIKNYHISSILAAKANDNEVLKISKQALTNHEIYRVLSNLGVASGLLSNNIIDTYGCVSYNGEIVDVDANRLWYRSNFIDIDKIYRDEIVLSASCNSNTSNPNAAPYAFFDKNCTFISAGQYGVISLKKSDVPSSCKYIVFSFYDKKEVFLYGYSIDERIEDVKKSVAPSTDNIKQEDKDMLKSLSISKNGSRPFNFIHLSDTHTKQGNTKCLENAISLLQEDSIDCAVISGDIVWDNFPDSMLPFDEAISENEKDIIMCVGNHDVGESIKVSDCGSDIDVYNKFYAPYIKENFVMGGDNKNYFYVDYPEYKIRFISIYQFNCDMALDPEDETKLKWHRAIAAYRQDEIDWLISTLNSTPEGYVVFPITHYTGLMGEKFNDWQSIELANTGNNELLGGIFKAFKNRSAASYTVNQTYNVVTELQITYDFTNAVADFGAWICGHTHDDFIGKDSSDTIWIMDKCADNLLYSSGTSIARVPNSYQENAINVVSVDTYRKTISVFRIGGKYSRNGDFRNVITFNYGEK